MKKLFIPVTLLLSLCSCSKESSSSNDFVPLDTIVCTRVVTVNQETKAGVIKPVELTLSASYNINEDCISSFSITSQDPEIDTDNLKALVAERFEEENGIALENSELNKLVAEATTSSDNPTKECFDSCYDKYEKGNGRGTCKAACVMDWIERVVQKVFAVFKK